MWYVVGTVAALLTSFGFVPQVLKIWKSKSVKDLSLITLIQFTAGSALWMVYGVSKRDPVIIGANIVNLGTLAIALGLYARYVRSKVR